MIHKLTLTTYLITSFVKKHSVKNFHKFSLHILTINCHSLPSFNISVQNFVLIFPDSSATQNSFGRFFYHKRSGFMAGYILELRKRKLHKINIFGHFLSRIMYYMSQVVNVLYDIVLYRFLYIYIYIYIPYLYPEQIN